MHPIAADTIRKWYAKSDQPEAVVETVDSQKPITGKAEKFLAGYLDGREQRSTDVMAKARVLGLHPKTIRRAKERLGVEAYQRGREWFWRMSKAA